MNTELQEKIRKYKENLETKLQEATKERQELVEKVNSGETLTIKEGRKNKQLATLIKEIKRRLEMFDEVSLYESIEYDMEMLSLPGFNRDAKDNLIKKLIENFKKITNITSKEMIEQNIVTEEELKDLDGVKKKITNEIKDLEKELELANKRGFKTIDIEKDLEDKKNNLELLEEYSNEIIENTILEKDLKKLSLSKTKKSDKDAILEKYKNIISKYKDATIEEIIIDMENNKIDLELKEKVEEELKEKNNWFKENWKKIAKITGAVVLTAAIIITAKQCTKSIESSKENSDINNNPTIEETINKETKKDIDALTKKGYNEYFATMMAQNFKPETIDTLIAKPYVEQIEKYANVNDFEYAYLMDYENARTIYNITPEKAVEYVNRASKIEATGFYNDAEINDIVAVIKSIDDQDLFMSENITLNQSITATLTDIYNNHAWTNEPTNEVDLKKLDALQYFAKDGSDLDLFLTEYAEIVKNILNAKGDNELINKESDNMYAYLDTFANTFAGNSYDIENPNENAIVTDTYDWNIAYDSFIRPIISMFITEQNAYNYGCLQINLLSNYEMWAQANNCYLENEESLTLGGE